MTALSPRYGYDELRYDIISKTFIKPNGSSAFVYWYPANLLKATLESSITISCAPISGTPHLTDLLDGTVYEIPESMMEYAENGSVTFKNLPLRDYPLLLTFGDFTEWTAEK